MLSTEEERIMRQIERGLRHDDPWLGRHLAMVRMRALSRRRGARVCLVMELAFVVLTVAGAVCGLPALLMLGAGFGVLVPMVALACWLPPPDPPDGSPLPPLMLGWW
ncbi:DUF3040 domain-containing protein [Amycolatopsis sp. K13G38]|uniref:DUF3040 domain-containing protein n=1 Tax=Amycolatopsis acididurans TaxID=2724524 RepID=A0ABX1JGD3_9PSEU|nr:DUF3040 domain-containing protein [Amycolatopsis acididurans]NKQ58857.1 DUF3040 domain-containing protein [Amycolatopsis acididurans]